MSQGSGAAPPVRRGHATGRALWDRWLQVVLVGLMAYGVALVVAGRVAGRLFEVLGFGMRAAGVVAGSPAERHVLLVYGVLGSVLLGWATMLLLIARGPLRSRDPWAWRTFAVAFGLWFVVDTTFSLAIGSVPHAVFNLAFLAAILPPLLGMRPERRDARAGDREGRASGPVAG